MVRTEFSAARGSTLVYFLGIGALALICGLGAAVFWSNSIVSGALLVPCAACLFGASILAYRLTARPVMLRISHEGIYLKRLGVTFPWEALARIERMDWQGTPLFALIRTDAPHPVFEERTVLLGAALNARLGLPDLAIQMSHYDGTAEDFEAAVRAAGGTAIQDSASEPVGA
ncbi:MAG: hypothetical protein MRY64_13535 [Hyphomonadaceae bacterium]|nr:hypothetical protein [Hyphomonadaceae bacterium]